ncbi:MAG: hypothetical protein RL544_636 [Bacteroidota bacterium]
MKQFLSLLIIFIVCTSCTSQIEKSEIVCSDSSCNGIYIGPEFLNGSDIAHQFSNKICYRVGVKLKALYKTGKYTKVDFSKIVITTVGMGSGNVTYKISIPLIRVKEKCMAFTSFDHVGGWNHAPALSARKEQLKSVLMKSDTLHISNLFRTKEGLEEYWIQWRNRDIQFQCLNTGR